MSQRKRKEGRRKDKWYRKWYIHSRRKGTTFD
jgi:hypothetical protein